MTIRDTAGVGTEDLLLWPGQYYKVRQLCKVLTQCGAVHRPSEVVQSLWNCIDQQIPIAPLACPEPDCCEPHQDCVNCWEEVHIVQFCTACFKIWVQEPTVVGNILAHLDPILIFCYKDNKRRLAFKSFFYLDNYIPRNLYNLLPANQQTTEVQPMEIDPITEDHIVTNAEALEDIKV